MFELDALKSYIIYRLLNNSEESFWGMYLNLDGDAVWILPISVEDFVHKEDGSWSSKDKWSVSPDSALVLEEHIKDVVGH